MRFFCLTALAAAFILSPAARADEVGGSGFDVPLSQSSEWLWGVEGLVRTPLDLSGDAGISFRNYELSGRATHDDRADGNGVVSRSGTLEFEPEAFEGGFRFAGGIGWWNCCLLFEPAIGFRYNSPFDNERTDDTPGAFDPNDLDEFHRAELEIKDGWDLMFGPQITWMIRDDVPFLGRHLGGLPLVFFPFVGVTHVEWDVEMQFADGLLDSEPGGGDGNDDNGTFDRNFESDELLVGFDLDIPLPGSHASFTHALTFGFKWIAGDDDHDLGPFSRDSINGGTSLPPGSSSCRTGTPSDDQSCFAFENMDGWRIGLYYRVTWNDFEGFFKRNIFGPVD